MIIYVTKNCGLYEPVVDYDGEQIYIPHWETKQVLRAEEEGAGYREVGAIMARITYDTLNQLNDNLQMLLRRVDTFKNAMENVFSNGEERGLAEFMYDNQKTFQHAGDSYLIKGESDTLELISEDIAKHLMERYQEEFAVED